MDFVTLGIYINIYRPQPVDIPASIIIMFQCTRVSVPLTNGFMQQLATQIYAENFSEYISELNKFDLFFLNKSSVMNNMNAIYTYI